jgi:hypothetical protein
MLRPGIVPYGFLAASALARKVRKDRKLFLLTYSLITHWSRVILFDGGRIKANGSYIMNKISLVWFLIAGIVGAAGSYEGGGRPLGYGRSLAWAIIALFAFLGLVGVIVV